MLHYSCFNLQIKPNPSGVQANHNVSNYSPGEMHYLVVGWENCRSQYCLPHWWQAALLHLLLDVQSGVQSRGTLHTTNPLRCPARPQLLPSQMPHQEQSPLDETWREGDERGEKVWLIDSHMVCWVFNPAWNLVLNDLIYIAFSIWSSH